MHFSSSSPDQRLTGLMADTVKLLDRFNVDFGVDVDVGSVDASMCRCVFLENTTDERRVR